MLISKFPDRFFITGTDTDVGKTVVSAVLMAGLKTSYWKPIQSGLESMTDTDWIRSMTGFADEFFIPEAYRLSQPLSPHASAANDGVRIELKYIRLPDDEVYPRLIVEGAGGVMVPLNENQLMIDLMAYLNLPVLLVARSTLGTINHTLLTLQVLRQHGLKVLGVVMNGPRNQINKRAIEAYGRVSVVAEVDMLSLVDCQSLAKAYDLYFRP